MEYEIDYQYAQKLTNTLINSFSFSYKNEIDWFYNSGIIIFLDQETIINFVIINNKLSTLQFILETNIPKQKTIPRKYNYLFNTKHLFNLNKIFYKCISNNKLNLADYVLHHGAQIHFNNDCSIKRACFDNNEKAISYLISTGYFNESNVIRSIWYSINLDKLNSIKVLGKTLLAFYILILSSSDLITLADRSFNLMSGSESFIKPESITKFRLLRRNVINAAFQLLILLKCVRAGLVRFSTYFNVENEITYQLTEAMYSFFKVNRKVDLLVERTETTEKTSSKLNSRKKQLLELIKTSDYCKSLELPALIKLVYYDSYD